MYDAILEKLIGRTIEGVNISKGEHYILFQTDEGPIAYQAEGDCCSESWFADVIGAKSALGEIVLEAKTPDLEDYDLNDGRGRQEEDTAYGLEITTSKGVMTIIFRNSSNGYYGGWLQGPCEIPADAELRPLTEDDWHA